MTRTAKPQRSIDVVPIVVPTVAAPTGSVTDPAPPLLPSQPDAPTGLAITPALARSASTPMAVIYATWDKPTHVIADRYTLQWSTDSSFPEAATGSLETVHEFATIDNLHVSTTYYVRVACSQHGVLSLWSTTVSATTPNDTIAPAVPTSVAAVFLKNGDLKITWIPPDLATSPNFRDVEIKIWDSAAKTTLYWTDHSAKGAYPSTAGEYIFTFVHNYQLTSGVPDKSLYVELRSRSWWEAYSIAVVVGTITKAAPGNPTGVTATWDAASGSFLLDWVDVFDALSYEITLDTKVYTAFSSSYTYPVGRNTQDHSGTPDPAITYTIKSVDAFGQKSTGVSATSTLARPATPSGLTSSWASDAGAAGPNCNITWNAQSGVAGYILTIDGIDHDVGLATRFNYAIDKNRAEHSGTPDPVLTLSLVARDGLGQTSTTPATATATNAAPPTAAVTLVAGFSVLAIAITPPTVSSLSVADLQDYSIRVIKDGSTLATYTSAAPDVVYKATVRGVYQVGVKVRDQFGQLSAETLSSSVTIDAITIDELRSAAIYTDSISTDFTTAPNKTVLRDDATGAGITYAASASAWRWTQIEQPLTERFRRVSAKLGSGSANFYVAVSSDGTTWTWYAGVGGDGYTLTARADEATAQANTSLASAAIYGWVELPTTVEGRYVRLYHRNTTTSYRLDEFYAYTIVIADMIRAGDVLGIHMAASTITADKISAAFTITGKNIQTATSGTRVVLSGDANGGMIGYGASDTYNTSTGAGTYQTRWSKADGKFYFGGGDVVLDNEGMTITAKTAVYEGVRWRGTGDTANIGLIWAQRSDVSSVNDRLSIERRRRDGSGISYMVFGDAFINFWPSSGGGGLELGQNLSSLYTDFTIQGAVTATISDSGTGNRVIPAILAHRTSGTPGAAFGVQLRLQGDSSTNTVRDIATLEAIWVTTTDASRKGRASLYAYDTAAREGVRVEASGSAPMVGFYGGGAVVKQTVSGSRGGNAALASLLTALASMNLITDNTT